MSRIRKSAKVGAVCCLFVGSAEGVRQNAYPDPATRGAPWTICYGETAGVKPGDHRTMEQCKAGLIAGLDHYADDVEKCIRQPMTDGEFVAYVSLAWNIGPSKFCRSSVARLKNAGKPKEACDAILRFNRAAGVVFPGLTLRRTRERAMCLKENI